MMLYTFLMMVIWSYFPVLNHVLYGDDMRLCFSYDTINEQKCETVVKKQCRTVQEEVTIITIITIIMIIISAGRGEHHNYYNPTKSHFKEKEYLYLSSRKTY